MSDVPTPSDPGSESLSAFLDLRDSLRTSRRGRGGRDLCEALTQAMDRAIDGLVHPLPDVVAVVAIGGYGRAELSPYSDIDLMLVHDVDDPAELAAALFRPLWDAKLRVGHAVRTLRDASVAAKERVDTHTTLLTSRLIAGDEDLFARLMDEVAAVTRARPLRRHVVAAERERRRLEPHPVMAVDVKNGRGGLRTLQGFEWEQRREQLIGRFSTDSGPEEAEAAETLLQVRNALQAMAGRAHDVFSVDLREPVARWLGLDVFDVAGRLVEAMQTVDDLATARWPEVVDEVRPRSRWSRSKARTQPSPVGRPTKEELLWMLESGERGRISFERLWTASLLDDVLPEWAVVRSQPQLAPFHQHPVAAHLWRTVDEMRDLIGQDGHYGGIARELDSPEVLLLAAFLHDIGKGHGGDHSVVGAGIARSFCERISISGEDADLIERAVLLHLLLPMTATRRDLDDPAVIEEVADTVGSLQLLQVLYLLTVADSRATGPTMWSDWKATLLRTLFTRCATRYGADRLGAAGTTRSQVLADTDPGRHDEIARHLDAMPDDYLRSLASEDVLWHLDLIAGLEGASAVGVRSAEPADTVVVIGHRRPGFRRRVAEAFAANGVDVLEARMLGRSDGMLLDTYRVRDDRTGESVKSERWDTLRADLEGALVGQLDTGSKLAARAAAYEAGDGEEPVVRGSVDAATGELVLLVKCSDRIGRLAEIVGVLDECDLEIRLAKIDSRQGGVVDTFHVSSESTAFAEGGMENLTNRIASALSP